MFQAQFIMVITYLSTLLAMDCNLPKALSVYMAFNTFIFLAMFLNFYRKTYVEKASLSPPDSPARVKSKAS
jgi:hypothetical protein